MLPAKGTYAYDMAVKSGKINQNDMKEFIVTFGQKYADEPHPKVKYAHPDGYLVIEATERWIAREAALEELGEYWSGIYDNMEQNNKYYPLGELHRIIAK